MTIFYFTATGNSLFVAKKIGGNLYSIPQLMKNKQFNFEDDIIGLVFPVYGWSLPKIVKEFLDNLRIKSNYTFTIGTYGNIHGSCMYNLAKYYKKRGIDINYIDSIMMVDNYLPKFDMDDQIKKLLDKKVNEKLDNIVNNIGNKINYIPKSNISERILTKLIKTYLAVIFNRNNGHKFSINNSCNKCGICTKVCPKKNIDIKENVVFKNNCETCYACIHNCPNNAIHLKEEKSNKRFRNENITLNEIIQANNQN